MIGNLTQKEKKEFNGLIHNIVHSEEFRRMKQYKHHLVGNTYEHSINVAYLCYRHYKRHKSKVDLNELIRGALLHDYFLYDRHDKSDTEHVRGLVHGFMHPSRALANATHAYPDLTKTERDVIKRHMFPLTPIPPKTRCGWLVCFYDKVAAICDYCHKDIYNEEKEGYYNGH